MRCYGARIRRLCLPALQGLLGFFWAGIIALADESAHKDLGVVNSAIYDIGRSSSYHKAFHDITTGFNRYQATSGWDPVTGWGSPDAHACDDRQLAYRRGSSR